MPAKRSWQTGRQADRQAGLPSRQAGLPGRQAGGRRWGGVGGRPARGAAQVTTVSLSPALPR